MENPCLRRPAARLHETRIASRYRNGYARSDQGALSGREYVIFGRVQVEPASPGFAYAGVGSPSSSFLSLSTMFLLIFQLPNV